MRSLCAQRPERPFSTSPEAGCRGLRSSGSGASINYHRERWRTLVDVLNLVTWGAYAGVGYPDRMPIFHFIPWWVGAVFAAMALQALFSRARYLPDLFEADS